MAGHQAPIDRTGLRRRWVEELGHVLGDMRRILRGGDLAGAAATLTYFSAIAIVPWLLLAVWSTTWFGDVGDVEQRLLSLRVLIPPDMGARPAYDALVDAGVHVEPLTALILLFPASFYGEGLRRACLALVPESDRFTGWRARVTVLALVVAIPPLAWIYCSVGEYLVRFAPEGGGNGSAADLLFRVWLGFVTTWLVLSVMLTWVFRFVTPSGPRWAAATIGALTTASFLAGFLQGFALFLSLPIDVGIPYAGIDVIGGVVAVGLWLWVLHMVLLVGWSLTRSLDSRIGDARTGHQRRPP
jgi:membrane protein